jgi:hypothetical protein
MALALTGLLYFNYKDIGISRAVKKVWALWSLEYSSL